MKAVAFAEHYDPEVAANPGLLPEFAKIVEPAQEWAMKYGHMLNDRLVGNDVDPNELEATIIRYAHWSRQELPRLQRQIWQQDAPEREKLNADGVLIFHVLSQCMSHLWLLETDPRPTPSEKRDFMTFAQDRLAFTAIHAYMMREKTAAPVGEGTRYFDPANSDRRAVIEGALNEVDSAIVLIEIAKKVDGMNVLPAPPQFERTHNVARNVDFVATFDDDQVLGIQVKTQVSDATQQRYDDDIVLIDSRVDMENHLAKRTSIKDTSVHTVSWAGLVAMHHILHIPNPSKPAAKKRLIFMDQANVGHVLRTKMHAQQATRGIESRIPQAADRIKERLFYHLEQQASPVAPDAETAAS